MCNVPHSWISRNILGCPGFGIFAYLTPVPDPVPDLVPVQDPVPDPVLIPDPVPDIIPHMVPDLVLISDLVPDPDLVSDPVAVLGLYLGLDPGRCAYDSIGLQFRWMTTC